ncbi:ABC-type Fe3+/spermidine/putrescine transport system ATPase subunit [Oribacterium sinus]|uniref:ABC-type quaternary amine transporter n=1 Tax=Oribacterium sinus TaxID=237576 RepID=A0A7W9W1M6_9FIRM|nr:ABC-type Fe3+/spermidine/putrescine transport system ATPase subunit [Oribacterium sinus]
MEICLSCENLELELEKKKILKDISLEVRSGEILALLGESGCGKSSLLKAMLGLYPLAKGKIFFQGKEIQNLPSHKRGISVVFQDLRLFPHLNVGENVGFSLELQKVPKAERKQRVEELLKLVQLESYSERRIDSLSGGQMQRVAIARALAMNEKLLFLDEPFSALDPNLRREMGDFLLELQRKENLTVVLVTHDQEEALRLAHRIALMKGGEILQVDEGEKLYYAPVSEYVARFMGKGNSILGRVEKGVFSCPYFSFPVEKEEGNYSFFFRERQLSFTEEIGERQIAERQIAERKNTEKQGESLHEVEEVSVATEALSPFKLIEKEYLGEFFRAFYKNSAGQVLSCLIERGEELPEKGFPKLSFKEGEEKILFFNKEGK